MSILLYQVLAILTSTLVSASLALDLDLSSHDWDIESAEIPRRDLNTIAGIVSPEFRDEVIKTRAISLKGTVPGYVLQDLYWKGIIEDPLIKDHDVKFRPLSRLTWAYRTSVTLPRVPGDGEKFLLILEGVDTVAYVIINGVHVFRCHDNQFRSNIIPLTREQVDTTDLLIEVVISPAVDEATKRAQAYPHKVPPKAFPSLQYGEPHRNFLRKSPSSFSWDWGPAFVPAGIWKPVRFVHDEDVFMSAVDIATTELSVNTWNVTVTMTFIPLNSREEVPDITYTLQPLKATLVKQPRMNSISITMRRDVHGKFMVYTLTFTVSEIEMWYPKGLGGDPNLYNLTLTTCSSTGCNLISRLIGFRTVELNQDVVKGGRKFEFIINGEPVYIRGANMVPVSVFEGGKYGYFSNDEVSDGDNIGDLLRDESMSRRPFTVGEFFDRVEFGGINTLRVWGGGVYREDEFYEEADRRGIMLWQEFMFACSMYPADERFLADVRSEVTEQLTRLKHHPSIVLLSGNNENKQAIKENWYGTNSNRDVYITEYQALYDDVIRDAVDSIIRDGGIPFLLSSPSNGERSGWVENNPQSDNYGDVHFYDYNCDCLNTDNFPIPRFASEFGFQSFPSLRTLRAAIKSRRISLFDKNAEHRQHLQNGNTILESEVARMFGWGNSLEGKTLVYLTQLNQALCVASEIAHFKRYYNRQHRSGRGLNTGVLLWQLNDVWAAPTWSVLDIEMRPKMLFYAMRQLYQEVIVSGYWTGNQMELFLVNELNQNVEYGLDIFLYDAGNTKSLNEWIVTDQIAKPRSTTLAFSVSDEDLKKFCTNIDACFVAVELSSEQNQVQTPEIVRPSFNWQGLKLRDPQLEVEILQRNEDRLILEVRAKGLAMWVWLEAEEDGLFTKNFFTMYQPALISEFMPRTMSEDCCKIHVTSLFDHYKQELV